MQTVYGSMQFQGAGVGGTLPKPANQISGRKKKMETGQWILILVPCFCYIVSLLSFTWWSFFYLVRLQAFAMIAIAAACGLMFSAKWDGPVRFGAMLSIFAIIVGCGCGWYVHETQTQFWYGYRYGEQYGNVVPSQAAASVADAAVLGFEDDAYVDSPHAAGLKPIGGGDKTYCVAPIQAEGQEGEVQFWAAGFDCCYARASFWCDGTSATGRKSGVIIFDTGRFKTAVDHFRDAIRLAEATWEVKSAPEPLIMRFVEDSKVSATIKESYTATAIWSFCLIVGGVAIIGQGGLMGANAFYV